MNDAPGLGRRRRLTVRVLGRLDTHVRLALVQTGLPLPALLLQGGLGAVLGVDVGQVGRGVVVGLHALIVLDLQRERRGDEAGPNRKH